MLTHIPIKICDYGLQSTKKRTCDTDFHSIADSIYDLEDFCSLFIYPTSTHPVIFLCPKWILPVSLHEAISDSDIYM